MRAHVDDESMLTALSPELQNEVSEYLVSPVVRHHPIFHGLPAGVMPRLAKILQRVEVGAGEIIVQQGEAGTAMYIIVTGEVQCKAAAMDTDGLCLGRVAVQEETNLSTGASFGEELFVSPGQFYSYTATAQKYVAMDALYVAAFREAFEDFPYVLQKVSHNAETLDERAEEHLVPPCRSFELEARDLLRELRESFGQLQAGLRQEIRDNLLRVPPYVQDGMNLKAKHGDSCSL